MKHLIIILVAIATVIACKLLKKNKNLILMLFLTSVIIISAFFMLRDIGSLNDYIRPLNQLFYQEEFLEDGIYADAILPIMVKGKTVYTKDDIFVPDFDMDGEPVWEPQINKINYGINTENLLKEFGARTIRDKSLNDVTVPDSLKSEFEDLGYANDMLRFSGAAGYYTEEYGNFFHHYYLYTAHGSPLHIYIHQDEKGGLINDCGSELVVLWEGLPHPEYGENIYIMDKEYFDERF